MQLRGLRLLHRSRRKMKVEPLLPLEPMPSAPGHHPLVLPACLPAFPSRRADPCEACLFAQWRVFEQRYAAQGHTHIHSRREGRGCAA